MKKILFLIIILLNSNILACDAEKAFWNEIKNSKDIEDFKYYRQKYKNGIFDYLALKNIRLLSGAKVNHISSSLPSWIKGDSVDHRYYAVAFASKHYKGEHYSENLARQRAKDKLRDILSKAKLDDRTLRKYNNIIKSERYKSKNGRIYVMVYINNYEL